MRLQSYLRLAYLAPSYLPAVTLSIDLHAWAPMCELSVLRGASGSGSGGTEASNMDMDPSVVQCMLATWLALSSQCLITSSP